MRPIDADALIEVIKKSMAENPHKEEMQRAMHIHEHKYFLTLLAGIPTIQPVVTDTNVGDTIYRKAAVELAMKYCPDDDGSVQCGGDIRELLDELENLPSAQPSQDKYEYHYDHTDCIWYRPEARNRCPATCAQYRDGWNDAMNYIFRDGEGYRPFRRDKKYEG